MMATTTATGTTGNDGEASPMRVTSFRLSETLSLLTTSAPMSLARNQAANPAIREIAREPPTTGDERGRDHDADGPQRSHRVDRVEEGLEVVGEAVEEADDVELGVGRVSLVEARRGHERDGNGQPEPVTGSPAVRLLGSGSERPRAPTLDREPRRVCGVLTGDFRVDRHGGEYRTLVVRKSRMRA